MADYMEFGDKDGIHLQGDEPLLVKIARCFTNIEDVSFMATDLLYGVHPGGGAKYVESQTDVGALPRPATVAHRVLMYWCSHKPDQAYGGKLVKTLRDINPKTARQFLDILVPSSAAVADTQPSSVSASVDEDWSAVVREWTPKLIKRLTNTDEIRIHCHSQGIVTPSESSKLYTARNNQYEHNELLVSLLERGTRENFYKFINILAKFEKYKDLVSDLKRALSAFH